MINKIIWINTNGGLLPATHSQRIQCERASVCQQNTLDSNNHTPDVCKLETRLGVTVLRSLLPHKQWTHNAIRNDERSDAEKASPLFRRKNVRYVVGMDWAEHFLRIGIFFVLSASQHVFYILAHARLRFIPSSMGNWSSFGRRRRSEGPNFLFWYPKTIGQQRSLNAIQLEYQQGVAACCSWGKCVVFETKCFIFAALTMWLLRNHFFLARWSVKGVAMLWWKNRFLPCCLLLFLPCCC